MASTHTHDGKVARSGVDLKGIGHKAHRMNRLGRRFLGANLAVLGVAILMIAVAANEMFINDHDRRLLMWSLVPAVLSAAVVAMLMARAFTRQKNDCIELN